VGGVVGWAVGGVVGWAVGWIVGGTNVDVGSGPGPQVANKMASTSNRQERCARPFIFILPSWHRPTLYSKSGVGARDPLKEAWRAKCPLS
jgi:hypothetical protein